LKEKKQAAIAPRGSGSILTVRRFRRKGKQKRNQETEKKRPKNAKSVITQKGGKEFGVGIEQIRKGFVDKKEERSPVTEEKSKD